MLSAVLWLFNSLAFKTLVTFSLPNAKTPGGLRYFFNSPNRLNVAILSRFLMI